MKLYCDRCLGGNKWPPLDKALKWMCIPGHQPVISSHSSQEGGGGGTGDFEGKLPDNTSSLRGEGICGCNAFLVLGSFFFLNPNLGIVLYL